jgi:hypothetical protein
MVVIDPLKSMKNIRRDIEFQNRELTMKSGKFSNFSKNFNKNLVNNPSNYKNLNSNDKSAYSKPKKLDYSNRQVLRNAIQHMVMSLDGTEVAGNVYVAENVCNGLDPHGAQQVNGVSVDSGTSASDSEVTQGPSAAKHVNGVSGDSGTPAAGSQKNTSG